MKSATLRLIEAAERLNMTGVIGDGTVAHFHELAALARAELIATAEAFESDTNLERAICCGGQDCGCMGSTAGQYAAYRLREQIGPPLPPAAPAPYEPNAGSLPSTVWRDLRG